jgi:hypothetical protein
VLIVTPVDRALRRVARVRLDNDNNRTSIDFEPLSDVPQTAASSESGVFAMRVKAAPFGHNAPLQIVGNTNGVPVMAEWDLAEPGEHLVTLDAVYDQIVAPSWVVIDRPSTFGVSRVQIVTTATQVRTLSRAAYGISARASQLTLEASWLSLPFVLGGVLTSQLSASGKMSASFGGVLGQGFLIDVLNVRVFDLSLSVLRDTVVYAQSERLTLSEQPLDGVVSGGTLELDGAYPGLDKNRHLAISGERVGGGLTSEIATIAAASTTSGVTTLTLEQGLANSYVRRTVVINANVSPATEGETVAEVLGSGDATASYQEFSLRQPPLTFVSASTPDGFASTLGVRVNDVAWHEAPTLYGRGPSERVYVTRTEDDDRTIVQFGNGAAGARLPSGSDNVRAVYRKGGGRGGNLDADRLSVLMTRPLGVTGVTNPEAATGGVDRQSRDDVRANAPLRCSPSIGSCRCATTRTSPAHSPASPRRSRRGRGTGRHGACS